MLKSIVAALMLCVVSQVAHAAGCQPVNAAQFIAEGEKAVQNGTVEGVILIGDEAAGFGTHAKMEQQVLAVFLIRRADGDLLGVVVFRTADGTEGMCYGEPQAGFIENVKRHTTKPLPVAGRSA